MLWLIIAGFVTLGFFSWKIQSEIRRVRKIKALNAKALAEYEEKKKNSLGYTYVFSPHSYDENYEWFEIFSLNLFIPALIGGVSACLLSAVFAFFGPMHTEHIGWCNLKALGDSSGSSGAFFLGTGYEGSDQVFNYYCIDDTKPNVFYRQYQLANGSQIIEQKGTPHLDQYIDAPNEWLSFSFMTGNMTNYFYVPAGTVKDNIKLDNQN